jgi:predicted ATPase/class 3 adenylate cyclase
MVHPPTGTVTFLFTDIEGSTKLWENSPTGMHAALTRHDTVLREAIEGHGGFVFKTVGDAFCCAFPTAPEALEASLDTQRALSTEEWGRELGPLRVRAALHTGAAEERGGDYFGPPLNRVARLLSAGHGGQVLLSLPTQELVRDQLPSGAGLRDLGERRLKDLFRPERVFQLTAPGLPEEFAPLRTLDACRNNLPAQPTPLVGREREVAAICERLRSPEVRLLTLMGPGGTGKTRVGLQAAAELIEEYEGGVFFVPLATVADPSLVASSVAGALGVTETGDRPLEERLKEYLRDREMLLLLDNFEQVLEATPFLEGMLAAAPRLKALVTSRAALRLYGEHEFPVPPLELPDTGRLPEVEALARYEAVRLFIERARAVKPDFAVTNENAPAVAEICTRLDGLPLAIELAATRIRLLPPKAMLARLGSRLKLLTGGARNLPERQRTLRGAIEWSHSLLTPEEQILFARLGVFSGGRTLEAIEAVCDPDGELDAFDGVESLLEKSLLRQEEGPDEEPRFVMLETIHEYATEKLKEGGEYRDLRASHVAYFVAFAEEAAPEIEGPDQVTWMDRLEAEHDNLRAALSWSLETKDAESALRIGGALWVFWIVRGHFSEGRRWLSTSLSGGEAAPSGVRARVLLALGDLANAQGDYTRAVEDLEASLSLYREVGDRSGEAYALCFLGWIALERNDLEQAERLLEESLALSRETGTARAISLVLNALSGLADYLGDSGRAAAIMEECLSMAREAGDIGIIAISNHNLGLTAARTGDYERAETLLHEAQELFWELSQRAGVASVNSLLGFVALSRNDLDRAESLCAEAIRELWELAEIPGVVYTLEILAGVAASRGEIGKAARLWGATAGYREATGLPWALDDRAMIEPHIDTARARLDEEEWTKAWEEGRAMSLEDAIAYALEGVAEHATEQC